MPLILPGNVGSATAGGYNVANSLRFNIGSSDSLTRTLGTPSNGKKFTISVWTKLIIDPAGNAQEIMAGGADGSNETFLRYTSNETIQFRHDHASDQNWQLQTNRKFRDPSAWYHIVAAVDTTQGTDTNRVKIYVNGVQETSLLTANYPAVNEETFLNVDEDICIAKQAYAASAFFSGYMSEFVFLDGQTLDPTSFGEFDSDSAIWKPIAISGLTFGNNGFYLEFKGSGTSANSSGLGADTSGNDLHFTVGNLTAVDQSTDTCTNNFATLNPLDNFYAASTLSEGNLKVVTNASNETYNTTTIGASSGKWYCEMKHVSSEPDDDTGTNRTFFGIADVPTGQSDSQGTGDVYIYRSDGSRFAGTTETSSYGDAWDSTGEIIGIAMDLDNNKLYFSVNGTFQNSGDPTSGATGTGAIAIAANKTYFFVVGDSTPHAITNEMNFGSPPFAISSGNTDAEGFGNFEFAVPSGYFALCSKNLAEYG
jgi:hypothetical protein